MTSNPPSTHPGEVRIVFRGRLAQLDAKLRAMYRHQLHRPGGVEGWSEWGSSLLEQLVEDYERVHGDIGTTTERLKPGRRPAGPHT